MVEHLKAYGCSTYFWGPGNQALNPLSPKTPLTLIFCLSWRRTQSISKCILRGLASGGISQLEKKYITFFVQSEELLASWPQLETS